MSLEKSTAPQSFEEQKVSRQIRFVDKIRSAFQGFNDTLNAPADKSRRVFNKQALAAAAILPLGMLPQNPDRARDEHNPKPNKSEQKEVIQPNRQQLLLDFAPMTQEDDDLAAANDNLRILDDYNFATNVVENLIQDWKQKHPEIVVDDELAEGLERALLRFSSHAIDVAEAGNLIHESTGQTNNQFDVIPLQNMLELHTSEYRDRIGNSGFLLYLPAEKIIESLENNEEDIVNMSFQVGVFGVQEERFEEIVDMDALLKFESAFTRDSEARYIAIDPTKQTGIMMRRSQDGQLLESTRIINDREYRYVVENNAYTRIVDTETGEELLTYAESELASLQEADKIAKTRIEEKLEVEHKAISAYEGEYAAQNLMELCTIAHTFPDKLFFAALGNEGENIVEIKRDLQDRGLWPDNLFVIGEWTLDQDYTRYPVNGSAGGDIYFTNNNDEFREKLKVGSSLSTVAMSSIAKHWQSEGLSNQEITQKIRSTTAIERFTNRKTEFTDFYAVFDEAAFYSDFTDQ